MDFLLLSFVFFVRGIKLPCILADDAFLRLPIANYFLKHSGAFFIRRNMNEDASPMFKSLLKEYFQQILISHKAIEFFIEGTRSRTGLLNSPKHGVISWAMELITKGKVEDVIAVPITIMYDRLYEEESLLHEQLGRPKEAESMKRIARASMSLQTYCGNVYMKIATPISLGTILKECQVHPMAVGVRREDSFLSKELNPHQSQQLFAGEACLVNEEKAPDSTLTTHNTKNDSVSITLYRTAVEATSLQVMESLLYFTYPTPTSLVSTILLLDINGIHIDDLLLQVHWLYNEVLRKEAHFLYSSPMRTMEESLTAVKEALSLLDKYVLMAAENVIKPKIIYKDFKSVLLLSFYKNQLIQIFQQKAIVCLSLYAVSNSCCHQQNSSTEEGILKEYEFLWTILKGVFLFHRPFNKYSALEVIRSSVQYGISIKDENQYKLNTAMNKQIRIFCECLWPFVESYWVMATTLLDLQVFDISQFVTLNNIQEGLNTSTKEITKEELIQRSHFLAESLFFKGKVRYYESCSHDTLKAALRSYQDMQIVEVVKAPDSKVRTSVMLTEYYRIPEHLQRLIDHIDRFRKGSLEEMNVLDAKAVVYSSVMKREQHSTEEPMIAKL
uniref:Glyceronephosphate O-acyltransferase n=1 Tax=Nephromyces sp. MMRI TaxID=2496275 RepID=A0A3Q8UBU2_9APIC|nr:glyceronephosphate O-acyltransferase [Nephromyces sp. MMRI]